MHQTSCLRGECVQHRGIRRFGVSFHGVHFQIGDRVCREGFYGWELGQWDDINDR